MTGAPFVAVGRMPMQPSRVFLSCVLGILVWCGLTLSVGTAFADEPRWPSPDWPTTDPADVGLDAPASRYHPAFGIPPKANAETGWLDRITIRHLATQTAGFEKRGGYEPLWWNNADGALPNVPRDAFWAWGLYDSLIVVVPSLDLVVVRCGERGKSLPREDGGNHYDVLGPLLDPIVAAAGGDRSVSQSGHAADTNRRLVVANDENDEPKSDGRQPGPPVPPSEVITGVEWAPADSIIRLADGSDNWPMTWADDGHLYTAYGDGWGFRPRVEKKLSLGLARVRGNPPEIEGENIRSESGETSGDGRHGKKASGMLMVDGVLYMWARNADNSQLAWSDDRGQTWTWADWRWETSFGYPTFLNFGKNYSGARDDFVYVYSTDTASAYDAADQMILARVPKDQIGQRDAYEFFVERDDDGDPRWTGDLDRRGGVFRHPGRCYRMGVTYNPGLRRYLWCQVHPESSDHRGPRFQGGFAVYEAAEPWGPWRTVFFTNEWDVGPGETSSLPTKWISDDGRTVHLVFSGDDHFSVRKGTLKTSRR